MARPDLGPLPPIQAKSGQLKPGSWAAYAITRGGRTSTVRMAALEKVGRAQWFEFTMTQMTGQRMVFKVLIEGALSKPKRLRKAIFQIGDQTPFELPRELLGKDLPFAGGNTVRPRGKGKAGARRTKVRVPGGVFTATHLRRRNKAGQIEEVWFSDQVAGWPLVKLRRPGLQMVLTGHGAAARSNITAEPVTFDPGLLQGLVSPRR